MDLGFWLELLQDFACMIPIAEIFKAQSNNSSWLQETAQEQLLEYVLNDSIMLQFPISAVYKLKFLKEYLRLVEKSGEAVNDGLMDSFMNCLANQPKLREEGGEGRPPCFKTYIITMNPRASVTVKVHEEFNQVGLTTWEAGFFLAEVVQSNRALFNQSTILEIGSGVGVTATVLSWTGCRSLCATDFDPDVLQLLQHNLSINNVQGLIPSTSDFDLPNSQTNVHHPVTTGTNILSDPNDLQPLISALSTSATTTSTPPPPTTRTTTTTTTAASSARCCVHRLDWDRSSDETISQFHSNVVIGADLIYHRDLAASAARVLGILLRPHKEADAKTRGVPVALIAQSLRNAEDFEIFLASMRGQGLAVTDITDVVQSRPKLFRIDMSRVRLLAVVHQQSPSSN